MPLNCKLRHLLAAVVSALMFCVSSSAIIMLNKWIISALRPADKRRRRRC